MQALQQKAHNKIPKQLKQKNRVLQQQKLARVQNIHIITTNRRNILKNLILQKCGQTIYFLLQIALQQNLTNNFNRNKKQLKQKIITYHCNILKKNITKGW